MHHPLANFPQSTCAKNYEKLLRVDKVITTNTVCSFFGPPCIFLESRVIGLLMYIGLVLLLTACFYLHSFNRRCLPKIQSCAKFRENLNLQQSKITQVDRFWYQSKAHATSYQSLIVTLLLICAVGLAACTLVLVVKVNLNHNQLVFTKPIPK